MGEAERPYGRFLAKCAQKGFACLYWLDGEPLIERARHDWRSQQFFGPAPGRLWRYVYSGELVPAEVTAGMVHAEDMGLTWRDGVWRGQARAPLAEKV